MQRLGRKSSLIGDGETGVIEVAQSFLSRTSSLIFVIYMAKCPSCKKESSKPKKSWNYGPFKVQAYSCECGTDFRDYSREGKHSFSLKLKKGKGYVKA